MKRIILVYYLPTVLTMFLLSCAYEFWIEKNFSLFSMDPNHHETTEEHWEYVLTVTFFSAVAIVFPTLLIRESEVRRERSEREKLEMQKQLDEALTKLLSGFVGICSVCKKVRVEDRGKKTEHWREVSDYISERTDLVLSHGYCPDCLARLKQQSTETS